MRVSDRSADRAACVMAKPQAAQDQKAPVDIRHGCLHCGQFKIVIAFCFLQPLVCRQRRFPI
ncbi:MAG: hypothetical protein KGO52_08775 [Nitrospirota bacterium]|nr:hypothetical protein [Nitrospirota bacterium]MDE3242795.1 hypothetical protein [Nitrospirota bacterium]